MKEKGFTLVEVLGVIFLLSLLSLLIIPTLLNVVKRSNFKMDEITLSTIRVGTKNYIDYNQNKYPLVKEAIYCIPLKEITDSGHLTTPIKDENGNEFNIDENSVKTKIKSESLIDIEIVKTAVCVAN